MANMIGAAARTVCALAVASAVSTVVCAEEWLELAPMTEQQLEGASGRQGVPVQWQFNDNNQHGAVTGNSITGASSTGDNLISDNAFGNMSGIATVIQNTGNQVVIQDSTQVNILINR